MVGATVPAVVTAVTAQQKLTTDQSWFGVIDTYSTSDESRIHILPVNSHVLLFLAHPKHLCLGCRLFLLAFV